MLKTPSDSNIMITDSLPSPTRKKESYKNTEPPFFGIKQKHFKISSWLLAQTLSFALQYIWGLCF